MKRILVPSHVKTNGTGYCVLMNIYEELKGLEATDAIIDFSECVEFDANLSAVLGSLFDDFVNKGNRLTLYLPKDSNVRKGLSRIKFLEAFNNDRSPEDVENYLEYRRFSPTDSEAFKRYIHCQLIGKHNFPAHSEMVGKHITESIFEIFINAVQHGACNAIYSCGERHGREHKTLDVTIVDRGHTIYKLVNEYIEQRHNAHLSAEDCIKWAVVEGNTTKSQPGGLGLALINQFLTLNKGMMQIVSHEGLVHFAEGTMTSEKLNCVFDGTIVSMKFNLNDNNCYYMKDEVDLNDLL